MSRSLRRGALAATAIVFSIASLSACGAGTDAQTLQVRPDNAETTVDTIKIQNATVITQPQAEAEGPAVVSATLFNTGSQAQTLDAITLDGLSAPVKLSAAKGSGSITIPAQGSIIIGGAGNAAAVIEKGQEASKNAGGVQNVVFRFSETGDVKVQSVVVPAKSYFEGYGPSSLPKPTTEPTGTPTGTPSASATGQPGNGESGEPGTASDSASASQDAGN
ncbi:hypothetical protein FBY35_6995 [Streptomyces sp. SLBN-118]|uniref:DUF461 domain-containing protein n=1 Tax=Streptomyces sp. SLBN-118 TaxID=2768454 RepID=UPI00115286A3|nr:DUF461 domain-containing protein [Streptomyces sp. SLBN-118]TQK45430.1 hypothetical protein FBY35_6995 [Streptomyces sp. SLBN-118]